MSCRRTSAFNHPSNARDGALRPRFTVRFSPSIFGICLLVPSLAAAAPSFSFDFNGCPAEIVGGAGETRTIEVFAALTTSGNSFTEGPQAWSLGVTATGGTIKAISVDGLQVLTIYDDDVNDTTPPVNPFLFQLSNSSYKDSQLATRPGDGARGAVSAVVMGQDYLAVLQPNSSARVARITVEAKLPTGNQPSALELRFEDGLKGSGVAVRNKVVLDEVTYAPALGACTIPLRQLPTLSFGFEGCPSILVGAAGEMKTFDVFATLNVADNLAAEGPQAWSLGVTVTNGTVKAISVDGITVPILLDEDFDDGVPPAPAFFNLSDSDYEESHLATRPADGKEGAVSAAIMGQSFLRVLPPIGTTRVARITVEAVIPAGNTTLPLTLRFEDGLKSMGQPVRNKVTVDEVTYAPGLGSCTTTLSSLPTVAFGFEGCPSEVSGQPGETKTFEAFVTIATSTNPGKEGPQGWSLGVTADRGTIKSISVDGLRVVTIYDDDVSDTTPPRNPYMFTLSDSDYEDSRLAVRPSDGMQGAVSAVIMGQDDKAVLQPVGIARVARITVEATIPARDSSFPLTLQFADGLVGGGRPVKNVVNIDEQNFVPSYGSCTVNISSRPNFALNFEGCPAQSTGTPGEVNTFDVFATLSTSNNPLPVGVQGWSISLTAEGGTIEGISVNGIEVSTIRDENPSDEVPPAGPVPFDLASSDFKDSRLATNPADNRKGAVSAVVLGQDELTALLPNGTARVARITVRTELPPAGQNGSVTLRLEDGFKGATQPRPIRNIVNLDSINYFPSLGTCTVALTSTVSRNWVRCDGNGDNARDLTDAVFSLNFQFLAGPPSPCPNSLDCNGDGAVDLTDAVFDLNFQFLAGPPPAAPYPECDLFEGCSGHAKCP